jgi:hypothetical protein
VALTEVIITQSNNVTLQNIYQTFQSRPFTTTAAETNPTTTTIQCSEANQLLSNDRLVTTRQNNVFPIVAWLSACNENMNVVEHLAAIIINIILFPISIVVGTLLGILSLFLLVLPGRAPPTILIVTFGAPFFIIFFIFRNIRAILQDLVDPLLQLSSSGTVSRTDVTMIHNIMERLVFILDSPMEGMVATLEQRTGNSNNEKANVQGINCEMKSLSCKNEELMDALP